MVPALTKQIAINGYLDITQDIKDFFESEKAHFNRRAATARSKERYFERQITKIYTLRFGDLPFRTAYFDENIDLREYFNHGWDFNEDELNGEMLEKVYRWGHSVLAKIKEKYQDQEPPQSYFDRLNEVAKSEYFYGAVCANFYYWLIDEFGIFKQSKSLNDNKSRIGKPSKLTYLLQLYYENGCKPLTKPKVDTMAIKEGFEPATMANKWKDLNKDQYAHNGGALSIKEFLKSYEALMNVFEDSNPRAFNDVKNHYDQLKETYPDMTY